MFCETIDLSPRSYIIWRALQTLFWLIGLTIVGLLIFLPDIGLIALWNVLIPIAPALLVFAPGLWRNVCPLGITSLAGRHVGISAQNKLTHKGRVWLNLLGVTGLLGLVFLRRVGLNTHGWATAGTLIGLALLSMLMGMLFEWKSGWCSGMCPVFGVEKLYGSKPLISFENAHCHSCQHCCSPCPDCTDSIHPLLGPRAKIQRITETLLVGGFPGYVWGWFHVPDTTFATLSWENALSMLLYPFGGLVVTALLFVFIRHFSSRKNDLKLVRIFAAATVSCYYWYRIPALVGYGPIPDDGVLIDLSALLPEWWVWLPRLLTTTLFVWWLVIHQSPKRHWLDRPAFAKAFESSFLLAATHEGEIRQRERIPLA